MYVVTGKRGTICVVFRREMSSDANATAQTLRELGWTVSIELQTKQGKKVGDGSRSGA